MSNNSIHISKKTQHHYKGRRMAQAFSHLEWHATFTEFHKIYSLVQKLLWGNTEG
jgi:hypothetical protein